jgi:hypothetical protein
MKNFLIQRITENDDYVEIPSDLPAAYSGGMTAPEFLSFLKQLGYDIELSYYRKEYLAKKDVPIKEIEDNPDPRSKHLYFKISLSIYLNYTGKNYPEIDIVFIHLNSNIDIHLRCDKIYTYQPDKNNPTIIQQAFIDFLLDIEHELPNIENANTLDQLKVAVCDLFLKIQEYKQN